MERTYYVTANQLVQFMESIREVAFDEGLGVGQGAGNDAAFELAVQRELLNFIGNLIVAE